MIHLSLLSSSKFTVHPISELPVTKKIESFGQLPTGWHNGEGKAISAGVRQRAKAIVEKLLSVGFSQLDAFAGRGDDILVTAYHGHHYLSICVENSGDVCLNYEIEDQPTMFVEGLASHQLVPKLREISSSIWNISASSTPVTLTTTKADSTIWHSSHTAGGYRVLRSDAQPRKALAFVGT